MRSTQELREILKNRILVLDGAMGTMIQRYKLSEEDYRGTQFAGFPHSLKGNNDLLSITQPQVIEEIHRKFLEAGADIIETNTFNANAVSMEDYHMQHLVGDLNRAAVSIARKVASEFTAKNPDKPRFVAGSIGPTNKTSSLSPDVNKPEFRSISFDELRDIYREQAIALWDAGVDILLVETTFDTLNAKAALFAINELKQERNFDFPVMLSGTITDASGRTLTGQTTEAFWNSVSHAGLLSVGLNCSLGADQLRPYISDLSKVAWIPVSAHPNAGLPNEMGEYDESPETMAATLETYLKHHTLNFVGGCCGTTPEHIHAIAEMAKAYEPREIPELLLEN